MSNFMTRRFTLREKILLGLLIVILLVGMYFFLVHYPIQERMNEIAIEQEEVQSRMDIAEIRKRIYDDMQKELENNDHKTYMPQYPNVETLIKRFDEIFKGIEPRINYGRAQEKDGIYSRAISFSFSVDGYETAKRILHDLTNTGFRCLMSNLTVSPASGGDVEHSGLTISGTITFYELA